jgi:transcriptional regulator with XRE-family HTH domain
MAEFLNSNWDKIGETNADLADEWGYKSPGIISMWRTGKSRVPIEKLGDLARKLGVDLTILLPLWVEQFNPERGHEGIKVSKEIESVFKRLATINEFAVLKMMRNGASHRSQRDPVYTARQLQAIEQIAADDRFANLVLDEAQKQGLINEIEAADEE